MTDRPKDSKAESSYTKKLLDLVERANRAFVPGLLNRDNMWGMEAREWREDYEKLSECARSADHLQAEEDGTECKTVVQQVREAIQGLEDDPRRKCTNPPRPPWSHQLAALLHRLEQIPGVGVGGDAGAKDCESVAEREAWFVVNRHGHRYLMMDEQTAREYAEIWNRAANRGNDSPHTVERYVRATESGSVGQDDGGPHEVWVSVHEETCEAVALQRSRLERLHKCHPVRYIRHDQCATGMDIEIRDLHEKVLALVQPTECRSVTASIRVLGSKPVPEGLERTVVIMEAAPHDVGEFFMGCSDGPVTLLLGATEQESVSLDLDPLRSIVSELQDFYDQRRPPVGDVQRM